MYISDVSDTGALVGSSINNVPINGNYNAATNAISFNDARQPGDTLFVSFYTGYVIPNEEGGACAMAGTYQEAELFFEESGIGQNRDIATIASNLTVAYPTIHAAWYAIWRDPIIQ
jgi:hypothetical protein